jgi:diguanylate cyclase (GGDEF)-like protein
MSTDTAPETPRVRVLLVDDDEDEFLRMRDLCQKVVDSPIELRWIDDYDAALAAMARDRPDVLLVDQRLGDRSGLELLRELADLDVPSILLTEEGARESDSQAMKAGAIDSLVKSELTVALLERAIRYACERKRIQSELKRAALTDALTGLASRTLLRDRLTGELARAQRNGTLCGLLFVDLDRFKHVNDTLGHDAGDALLREVAARLRTSARKVDTVARLGGDEFVILLSQLKEPGGARVVAQRVIDVLAKPVRIGPREVQISASVGLAVHPEDGADAETLLKNADIAMYAAKEAGRNGFQYFAPRMAERVARRVETESLLRGAAARREFALHFQPIVELSTGKLCSVEALLRWAPGGKMVSPAEFIPILEEIGMMHDVGDLVIDMACAELVRWRAAGLEVPMVSVNVSPTQLHRMDLVDRTLATIERHGLVPSDLELELTETALITEATAGELLGELAEAGIRLALDDFGTGYAGLSSLRDFPLSTMKIDRSFVREAASSPRKAALSRAMALMGRTLDLSVVAEGVETEEQLAFLRDIGVDAVQGFLVAKPAPASELATKLAGHVWLAPAP